MTINDQIRDEKLQHDINRETAKISALSSGKIWKYEYLNGKEILPSDQQHIIDQAKFTYSPLEKAFEKQTKTIEDQGQKQVEALENLKPKELAKAVKDKSSSKFLTKKEIYNRLFDKRLNEIQEISNEIGYNNLNYSFKTRSSGSIYFIKYKGPFGLFGEMRDGNISLKEAEENQEDFKKELGQITSGNPKHKEQYQLETIKSVKNLYNSRQKFIDLFNDSAKIRSEAMYRSKQNETEHGTTGLKILTPKQMLQRLPIAFAQVKAGNDSESLSNEIRQIVYSLY